MKQIVLVPRKLPSIPIEAEVISPEIFSGKNIEEIKELQVWNGNCKRKLGDFFSVKGVKSEDPNETHIVIQGDVSRVKYIGKEMHSGKITINGNAGMHLADEMKGGEIIVNGDAADWVATEMRGGTLKIKGNAGNMLASAHPGSERGMKEGIIIVEGNAASSLARKMRRGTIIIYGDIGDHAGSQMIAGTIICLGNIGRRPGALMKRGTIIVYGKAESILPTFIYDATYQPTFIRFYLKNLKEKLNVKLPAEMFNGDYERFHGDIAEDGKGEILLFKRKP